MNEGALLDDEVDNYDYHVLEGPDTDVGDAAYLHKVVEDTGFHFCFQTCVCSLDEIPIISKLTYVGIKTLETDGIMFK